VFENHIQRLIQAESAFFRKSHLTPWSYSWLYNSGLDGDELFFVEILENRQFRLISPVECDFQNGISENRIFLGYEIETMV